MRQLLPSWIRIPVIFILIVALAEYFLGTGEQYAFIEQPIILLIYLIVLLILIAAEVVLGAVENTMYKTLNPEAQERYMRARQERLDKLSMKSWFSQMKNAQPEERDLELDHNYDGIKELDNKLPPWWLYSFYATIIFAFGYMAYYHVFDGDTQDMEFQNEMAEAAIAIEEYKKNAPDLIDADNVTALTDAADIEKGQSLYQVSCMACHAVDGGGGIGPNLTDEHWILGGGVKNIYHTISEGGRAGKGMIAWKSSLSPSEIQQISSYILTLEGTTPAAPKDPEGDIWTGE